MLLYSTSKKKEATPAHPHLCTLATCYFLFVVMHCLHLVLQATSLQDILSYLSKYATYQPSVSCLSCCRSCQLCKTQLTLQTPPRKLPVVSSYNLLLVLHTWHNNWSSSNVAKPTQLDMHSCNAWCLLMQQSCKLIQVFFFFSALSILCVSRVWYIRERGHHKSCSGRYSMYLQLCHIYFLYM